MQYAHEWGREGSQRGKKMFADVRAELFWRAIYCADPRPDADSQYGSWS